MDENSVPFGTNIYWLMAGLLFVGRALDFLSTWVATPNLVHEANPLARKLGWKGGAVMNVALCFVIALWPLLTISFTTTSFLVAARNFKSAWMMRTMGEGEYGHFMLTLLSNTRRPVYLVCIAGEALLTITVGLAVALYSEPLLVPMSIGIGIAVYGVAVGFYTLLSAWHMRHRMK